MNVLYEDSGTFKVATVLAEGDNSVQVEAPHGKRAKIRSKDVLLRFSEPSAIELLAQAEAMANHVDADFLWECCGAEEFGFADLAHEYCGHPPSAVEAAGILVKLHSVPVYFYRKGRGRYRAAPPETLRAALTGIEKKKQQQVQVSAWADQLARSVAASKDSAEAMHEAVGKLERENAAYAARLDNYRASLPMPWVAAALLVTLIGGFAGGLWWLDALVRRRHSGFRVY